MVVTQSPEVFMRSTDFRPGKNPPRIRRALAATRAVVMVFTISIAASLPAQGRPLQGVLEELSDEAIAVGPRLRDRILRSALEDDLLVDAREVESTTSWLEARDLPALEVSPEGALQGWAKRGRRLLLEGCRVSLGSARWHTLRTEMDALIGRTDWSVEAREQMLTLLDHARTLDSRHHSRDPYSGWAQGLLASGTPGGRGTPGLPSMTIVVPMGSGSLPLRVR